PPFRGTSIRIAQEAVGKWSRASWWARRGSSPGGTRCTPSCVEEPGDVLDQLVGDVEHGRGQNRQGSSDRRRAGRITTSTMRSSASSPVLANRSVHSCRADERGSVTFTILHIDHGPSRRSGGSGCGGTCAPGGVQMPMV